MLDHYITWNGKSSNEFDFNVIIKKVPNLNRPQRKYDSYNVDGRMGDIIVQQDAWNNVKQEYTLFLAPKDDNPFDVPTAAREISEWLYTGNGYCELSDSYEPDYFRLAHFEGATTIENQLESFGEVKATFDCKPQRFLNSGKEPMIGTHYMTIINPTAFPSLPKIRVYSGERVSQINFRLTPKRGTAGTPIGEPEGRAIYVGVEGSMVTSGWEFNGTNYRVTYTPRDKGFRLVIPDEEKFPSILFTVPLEGNENPRYTYFLKVDTVDISDVAVYARKKNGGFRRIYENDPQGAIPTTPIELEIFNDETYLYMLFTNGDGYGINLDGISLIKADSYPTEEIQAYGTGYNAYLQVAEHDLEDDGIIYNAPSILLSNVDEYVDVDFSTKRIFKNNINMLEHVTVQAYNISELFAPIKPNREYNVWTSYDKALNIWPNWWTI